MKCKSNDSEAIVMEEQYYNCAIRWARLLLELKFKGNMLFFSSFFFSCQTCWFWEVDIYVGIASILWKTPDQLSPQMNVGWEWPQSEREPELHLEFFCILINDTSMEVKGLQNELWF